MLMLFTQKFGTPKSKEKEDIVRLKGLCHGRLVFFGNISNREEKSFRNVAMVAKFLDDNKPKNVT